MKPTAVLLALLLLSTVLLAGCSGVGGGKKSKAETDAATEPGTVEFEEATSEPGRRFLEVAAPVWKTGYHFTYEDQGAVSLTRSGAGAIEGAESESHSESWGPVQGSNYTVVNVTTRFAETVYLALHHDEHPGPGPGNLLAIPADRLQPFNAFVDTYCDGQDCTFYVQSWGDDPEAVPAVVFPLVDQDKDVRTLDEVEQPFVNLGPVHVRTKVLGVKDVDGPQGKVEAVHVRQDFLVNMTEVQEQARADGEAAGITDLRITGSVKASRDVFYAPSLLNVVLDQSQSTGTYSGSYKRDGARQTFEESWSSSSTHRLVAVSLTEAPGRTLEDLAKLEHPDLQQEYTGQPRDDEVQIAVSDFQTNVALAQPITIELLRGKDLAASKARLEVRNARGFTVDGIDDDRMDFSPSLAGPYLVLGYAFDENGKVLDVTYTVVFASYQAATTVDCGPAAIAALGGVCPGLVLPVGFGLAWLQIVATFADPLSAAPLPGDLVVVTDNSGQAITSPRSGSTARIDVTDPQLTPFHSQWETYYRPGVASVATMVTYDVRLYPGSLPGYVYQQAMYNSHQHAAERLDAWSLLSSLLDA